MKKQILSLAVALAIFGGVNAANGDNAGKNDSKKAAASEKAVKNFHRQYKSVSNETWSTLSDAFKVEFMQDSHKTTSVYGKRGNWLYTIERFPSDNLTKDLIDRVKTRYDNYSITIAEKVNQPASQEVFIVHLENKDSYKTIMVTKDDIAVMEEFSKG